jgi:hypothetical protein
MQCIALTQAEAELNGFLVWQEERAVGEDGSRRWTLISADWKFFASAFIGV